MTLTIKRLQDNTTKEQQFTLNPTHTTTLLAALYEIKSKQDPTLTFDAGCRSGVCGRCSVVANGKEVLACAHAPSEGELIEPLRYHTLLRDLKVDKSKAHRTLIQTEAWQQKQDKTIIPNHDDEKKTERQSDCILCDSCYSACPVYAVNPDFLGPFALTRAYRYTAERREKGAKQTVDTVQENGIWDCTLCGECTMVCPQGIDPKMDIIMLRGVSVQHGYEDRSFAMQDFSTPDFGGGGFGF